MRTFLCLTLFCLSGFFIFAQTEPVDNSATPAATESIPTPEATPPPVPSKTDWDAGPNPTPTLQVARFRWWAPENAKDLRGIMIIIPGRRGDARGSVNDPDWRALAEKVRFALIGVQLDHPDGSYQNDPDGKTSEIIEKAVEKLAIDNDYPQLKSGPLAFWGHSAGSNTEAAFASRNPKKVVAVVSIKGPNGPGAYDKDKGEIPYLICTGAKDNPDWIKESTANYEAAKEKKAVWTRAFQINEGHEGGKTKPLALIFLAAAINERMDPPTDSAPPSRRLKDINPSSGWLGDPKTLDIAPYAEFKGKKKEAVWLLNEETAQAWKTYVTP